jgi:MFS family permease
MQLTRFGGAMWGLAMILFTLERFHSPAITGLVAFFGLAPAALASPIAGALLDRYGRVRLIGFDLLVAMATIAAIVGLDAAGRLSPPALIAVVALSSLTLPMTASGIRSIMPLLTPRELWDRVNAVDSSTMNVAQLLGPAAAGVLVGALGGRGTLVAIGGIWLAAMLLVMGVREPAVPEAPHRSVLVAAWQGLAYVWRNRTLRGMSLLFPLANSTFGALAIALPVLVLGLPHGGSTAVGLLWSGFGLAALVAGLLFGRVRTEGRERAILAITFVLAAAAVGLVAAAPATPAPLAVAAAGLIGLGLATGPADVALFSLRQRATNPAWFGRAMSISMSVNGLGDPVGSVLAGPAVGISLPGTIAVAAALNLVCAGLCFLLLPRRP